jgi:hypothetical protein
MLFSSRAHLGKWRRCALRADRFRGLLPFVSVQETDDPDALNALVLERVDRTKNMPATTSFRSSRRCSPNRPWCAAGAGLAAPDGPGPTFIPPSPSRRSRSTNGSSASGAPVSDSASDRRRSSFCRVVEESYGAPATASHSQRRCIRVAIRRRILGRSAVLGTAHPSSGFCTSHASASNLFGASQNGARHNGMDDSGKIEGLSSIPI